MDLRQMRQFVAVAEELNFRKAAQRLHMSQPPLSAAVQNLERDLGAALLYRSRQHVELTPAGRTFLIEARRLLAQAELSAELTRQAAAGVTGTLRLSFFPSAAFELLPDLLSAFGRDYPEVKLVLSAEISSRQSRELLRTGIDVALIVPPVPLSRDLRLQPHGREELMLALPSSHPFAQQAAIELGELARERFVGFDAPESPAFQGIVAAACQKSGFLPRVVQTAAQMTSVVACVAAGAGVALVPASTRVLHMRQVSFVEVRQEHMPVTYEIALAYHAANDNPALPPFLAMAARHAPSRSYAPRAG